MLRKVLVALAALLVVVIVLGFSGIYGLFAGPDDFNRHFFANELICEIDQSVREEIDGKLPNGYLTSAYSPTLWLQYWSERVSVLASADLHTRHEGYVGPTGRQLVLYALQCRREADLPGLTATNPETQSLLRTLYSELGEAPSCDFLDRPSPECSLSPAQYPGPPESRRLTRRCS